jgi:hypothetical protein
MVVQSSPPGRCETRQTPSIEKRTRVGCPMSDAWPTFLTKTQCAGKPDRERRILFRTAACARGTATHTVTVTRNCGKERPRRDRAFGHQDRTRGHVQLCRAPRSNKKTGSIPASAYDISMKANRLDFRRSDPVITSAASSQPSHRWRSTSNALASDHLDTPTVGANPQQTLATFTRGPRLTAAS